ncbi:DUF6168 family protein [Rasiella sp. SM2506]|uniref:DUF6168 family protein n=1 Tax=Rasiella sp. SM2506 TaxID=3423914 RepID=UPI003D7AADC4
MPKTLKFLTTLLLALVITFSIHIGVLWFAALPLFSDKILLSYSVNYLLAAFIYLIIQQTLKKNGTHAGFVFMAGSAVKFIIFFLVFYPFYQADDSMQKTEFTAFFIPYAICLILEVTYLSKQLNNQSYSEENNPNSDTTNS